MPSTPLTPEVILDTAEDVLRRFGPTKATVVDVARALDISHGSVYRHFPSKAALRDAVVERWLARISEPLHTIAHQNSPPFQRLKAWLDALVKDKRTRAAEDPELFASYMQLADNARAVITHHVDELVAQLAQIVTDGVEAGDFHIGTGVEANARAILHATAPFHNPVHVNMWRRPTIDDEYDAVWQLIARGLRP